MASRKGIKWEKISQVPATGRKEEFLFQGVSESPHWPCSTSCGQATMCGCVVPECSGALPPGLWSVLEAPAPYPALSLGGGARVLEEFRPQPKVAAPLGVWSRHHKKGF